jgi:hypothetical protein
MAQQVYEGQKFMSVMWSYMYNTLCMVKLFQIELDCAVSNKWDWYKWESI